MALEALNALYRMMPGVDAPGSSSRSRTTWICDSSSVISLEWALGDHELRSRSSFPRETLDTVPDVMPVTAPGRVKPLARPGFLGPMSPDTVEIASLLRRTTVRAVSYLRSLDRRPVASPDSAISKLDQLSMALPGLPTPTEEGIERLDTLGFPATAASNGGRYFGFVIGSSLPAALAPNRFAGAWNRNSCMEGMSTVAARLDSVALGWIRDVLCVPASARGAFMTGDEMAIF